MRRVLLFAYGLAAFATVGGVFAYFIAFVGDLGVPRSVDRGPTTGALPAAGLDIGLMAVFALQHSVMARPWFKRWWVRLVPTAAERSTFILASAGVLALLCWQWRPIPAVLWNADAPAVQAALRVTFAAGWVLLFASIHLMGSLHFFGLRQVIDGLRGRETEPPPFVTPSLYRLVRHPLYVGLLMGLWAAPTMTVGHLLLAGVLTGYVLAGIRLEERDLVAVFGDAYRRYRARTPMLVPGLRGRAGR